jgi:hypothetical protein
MYLYMTERRVWVRRRPKRSVNGDGATTTTAAAAVAGAGSEPAVAPVPEPESIGPVHIAPAGGSYDAPVLVALACDTPGVDIFYTVDGAAPGKNSRKYSIRGPFLVEHTATIKARYGPGGRRAYLCEGESATERDGPCLRMCWGIGQSYSAGPVIVCMCLCMYVCVLGGVSVGVRRGERAWLAAGHSWAALGTTGPCGSGPRLVQ